MKDLKNISRVYYFSQDDYVLIHFCDEFTDDYLYLCNECGDIFDECETSKIWESGECICSDCYPDWFYETYPDEAINEFMYEEQWHRDEIRHANK
jgi:hypothetical protein